MKKLCEVVLTGIGAITSRGDLTLHSQSAPEENTATDFQIRNFSLDKYLSSAKTYLDRCSALALAGGALALRDAQIEWPLSEEKFGITLGTHFACLETMKGFWDNAVQKGTRLANPILFSHSYINSPISLCAIEFGLKGYHSTFCANEYSGLEAMRAAYDAIRLGHVDAMLCGGVDAITPTRKFCQGIENIGEASVFLVLESEDHARQRGVTSTRVVEEAWFNTSSSLSEVESLFGNCGGATSILTLVQIFVGF